jgi:AraC-like DNA-binding protein
MEGEIEYYFPDKTIVASAGSVMLFPSNVPYHGVARTQRVAYYVLDFQTLSENEICDFGAPCIAKLKSFDTVCRDFSNVVSVWGQQKMDAVIRTKAFLYSMLALLMENEGRSSLKQERDDIFTYIFDHYTDPDISVLSLCEKFYISESQLRRNALKITGLTTNEYITFLRLTRAKRELICTQKSIKQIAYECGFSSAYYFSRSFHLHEKVSPKEYRQNSVML